MQTQDHSTQPTQPAPPNNLPSQWALATKGDQDAWTAALVMAGTWGEKLMLSAVQVITGAMPLAQERSCLRCVGCGTVSAEDPSTFCDRWEDDTYADVTFAACPERAPHVIALWCDGFRLRGE